MATDKDGSLAVSDTSIPRDKSPDGQLEDLASKTSVTVESKYLGTSTDQHDMAVLGKKQVLRRNFRFLTMIGFGSTVICSWEISLPVLPSVLIDGGTAGLFWGFIAIVPGMLMVYASLAEMGSMCPTAGDSITGYLTGWLCALGWQVFLASVAFMIGSVVQGLIALNYEEYAFQPWHATLLAIGAMAFAIFFNTLLSSRLPFVQGCALVVHISGFFIVFICMWVLAPRVTATEALLTFSDNGGWNSLGWSTMIGLTTPISMLIGYDCSVHMAEETQDSSLIMPRVMIWAFAPNAALAFLMVITLVFTIGDIEAVLGTTTRQPFIQIFYNATQSHAITNAMVAVIVTWLLFCCISEVATVSRQLWSFARDRDLPASRWLSHVTPHRNIPLRAIAVSFVISSLLACINLGSTVTLNAINSLGAVAIISSYLVTITCVIWRRLYGAPLSRRRWTFRRYGLWLNIEAVCWLVPMFFLETWPLARPITLESINWSSVMFVGVILISLVYYAVHGRHVYTVPVMQVKRDD